MVDKKGTFKMQRLAKAFLRVVLAAELLKCLDLDAMTTEEPHLTDEVFKNLHADMVYRVPSFPALWQTLGRVYINWS